MPDCRRIILHYAYLIRKKHHPRSSLVQINGSIDGNISNGNSINYFDGNYSELFALIRKTEGNHSDNFCRRF